MISSSTALGRFSFHFDSVSVTVASADPRFETAMSRLAEDFENFPVGLATGARISVELTSNRTHSADGIWKTRLTPRYRFFPRVCEHGGGTTSAISRQGDVVSIAVDGTDVDHVYEIAYVAILSTFGWEVEKLGFVRLHALAVAFGDEVCLFHLPPKGGKSTLALECLREGHDVLGDELALVKDGRVHAFPIRIAISNEIARRSGFDSREFRRKSFDDKSLVRLPRPRLACAPLGRVVFQSTPGLATGASPSGVLDSIRWVTWIVSGVGLPQMREFMLRLEEIPWIPAVAWRRLKLAMAIRSSGRLRISRAIVPVGSASELRPRLGWARSSSGTNEEAYARSRSSLRPDTKGEELA